MKKFKDDYDRFSIVIFGAVISWSLIILFALMIGWVIVG